MHKPWYSFLYVKSPIAKIFMGGAALLLTLALFGFTFIIEEPRMQAQTGNWNGRRLRRAPRSLPTTAPVAMVLTARGCPA